MFEAATSYGILMLQDGELYQQDYERRNRFYVTQGRNKPDPHRLNFMVIRRSMKTRYFLEMGFFFCLALAFQFSIFSLNDAYLEMFHGYSTFISF